MHVPPCWAKEEHRFDAEGRHRVVAWRWSDASLEEASSAARARWLTDYRERSRGFATCHLLLDHGTGPALPEAARVRELHDRAAVGLGTLPLA